MSALIKSPRKTWCYDSVLQEALNCNTRTEFKMTSRGAFNWAVRNNKLDDVCSHMLQVLNYWDLKSVKSEAKKYKTRLEFQKRAIAPYKWAMRNKKLDIVCAHMEAATSGFDKKAPAILYFLQVEGEKGETLYKIGITNRTVKERFGSDMKKITILAEYHFSQGQTAADLEKEILNKFSVYKYTGNPVLKDGNTELFHTNISIKGL